MQATREHMGVTPYSCAVLLDRNWLLLRSLEMEESLGLLDVLKWYFGNGLFL
jgi:hypothetical protein